MSRAYRHNLNGSQLEPGAPQLEARNVGIRFGGVRALDDVSLQVRQGEVHAIIGPNGAGKTSLLNCTSGLYRPQRGSIVLHTGDGEAHDVTKARPARIARWGVARSFQNIELFKHMTVLENLMLGRHLHMRHSVLGSLVWFGPARRQEMRHRELVEEVIDFLEIEPVRKKPVGTLAYGVQNRVELGRALCMQPAIPLLDEPMSGMNAEEKEDMARFILDVNQLAGITVVLIEHDMGVVMDISDRVTVLDFGKVIADGPPAEVSSDPDVIKAYLGEEHAVAGASADRAGRSRRRRTTRPPTEVPVPVATFPQLLRRLAAGRGARRHALREKRYGIWQPHTWADYEQRVRHFACGLASMGFERGETLAILGDNRPEWVISELAAQSLGGRSVGLYPEGILEEVEHVLARPVERNTGG